MVLRGLPVGLLAASARHFALNVRGRMVGDTCMFLVFLSVPDYKGTSDLSGFRRTVLLVGRFARFTTLVSVRLRNVRVGRVGLVEGRSDEFVSGSARSTGVLVYDHSVRELEDRSQ